MTILLISPDGMLGRAFGAELRGTPHESVGYPDLDLTRPESIERHVRSGVECVLNCAAYTDVDAAETQRELADAINGHGVRALAERCLRVGAMLVHFGTDYVFGGTASTPYPVDAPLCPVNAYGHSKALGERALREVGVRHLHVRTSWLYAPWGKNFVRTIATLAREKRSIRVVNDQRGRPTSAEHLARTTLALLDRRAQGTWHVTDGGECTWFDLAREVVRLIGASCNVEPCATADVPRPAPRPSYSVLDLGRTEALLGAMPPWTLNVADVLARLEPA